MSTTKQINQISSSCHDGHSSGSNQHREKSVKMSKKYSYNHKVINNFKVTDDSLGSDELPLQLIDNIKYENSFKMFCDYKNLRI